MTIGYILFESESHDNKTDINTKPNYLQKSKVTDNENSIKPSKHKTLKRCSNPFTIFL